MAEVICPENILKEVDVDRILDESMIMKNKGLRLSQACAAYVNGKYELSYSFAEEGTYQLTTLRTVIDPETEVSSITEFFPYAFLYENEMRELFGVKIQMTKPDYQNKLYRIRQETPFFKKAEENA
ncbi:MAG: NADH-quinone oxidoreductase subunit C [Lachnospiraceae bacterium]|nr:NADH-quinone oxidoreductase subunit C [Lachnospiraceae bacterium]